MKNKKPLIITLVAIDVAITVFLFVISILMLANTAEYAETGKRATGLIGYLQEHTTLYLWAFVVPLFVLLAVNIVGLVIYVKKTTKKEPVKVNDLTDEQREALRQELLKDLQGDSSKKE